MHSGYDDFKKETKVQMHLLVEAIKKKTALTTYLASINRKILIIEMSFVFCYQHIIPLATDELYSYKIFEINITPYCFSCRGNFKNVRVN